MNLGNGYSIRSFRGVLEPVHGTPES